MCQLAAVAGGAAAAAEPGHAQGAQRGRRARRPRLLLRRCGRHPPRLLLLPLLAAVCRPAAILAGLPLLPVFLLSFCIRLFSPALLLAAPALLLAAPLLLAALAGGSPVVGRFIPRLLLLLLLALLLPLRLVVLLPAVAGLLCAGARFPKRVRRQRQRDRQRQLRGRAAAAAGAGVGGLPAQAQPADGQLLAEVVCRWSGHHARNVPFGCLWPARRRRPLWFGM